MYINIGTVTIRRVIKTKWNQETKVREELMPDDWEYEDVAVDKHIGDLFSFSKVLESWHQRLPYCELDVHFQSDAEW
jgi:hypothetical protein